MTGMKSHSSRLGEEPVLRLIGAMSAPAVISMVALAAYNLVDAIFVGRLVGESGLAALGSNIPAVVLFMGFALFIGVGGSTAISRALGKAEGAAANQILGVMMFMVVVFALASLVLSLFAAKEFLILLGTSQTLVEPASAYLCVYLYGGPFTLFTVALNNAVRAEGNARMAMTSMITGALVNVLLDPLFIKTFGWGLKGAAWATVAANVVTSIILFTYIQSGKSSLTLALARIRFRMPVFKDISAVGLSTLLMNTGAMAIQSLVVRTLIHYGGEMAVSVYAICNRTVMFLFMPLFGIQAGVLPILGFNYGARLLSRVRKTLFTSMGICTIYLTIGWALVQLFPDFIVQAFTDDATITEMGISAIRKLAVALPVVGIPILIVGAFQAIGKGKYALLLAANRAFFLVIPLLLFLPTRWGTDGVWYAFPISDSLAMCINILFLIRVFRNFRDVPAG